MPAQAIARSLSRRSGVLLHITSLSGPGPVGDLDDAMAALPFLADAGLRLWQLLPVCPTDPVGSPYSSWSSLSGNPLIIGLAPLIEASLLPPSVLIEPPQSMRPDHADLGIAASWKIPLLETAARALIGSPDHPWHEEFRLHTRVSEHSAEAGIFRALRDIHGSAWNLWPEPLRDRHPHALEQARKELSSAIDVWTALEFFFDRQWQQLRGACETAGVELVGDLPIYVGGDSVDVWRARPFFQLDASGRPLAVSGCPPDGLNPHGQVWGTPLYLWHEHLRDDFGWWTRRMRRMLVLTDHVRFDHFIGLANFWSIPVGDEDASSGRWEPAPGSELLSSLSRTLGALPLIAEDLGVLSEPVRSLRDSSGIPGMAVLQFGFDGTESNPHHPDSHGEHSVCFTGTHDTPTLMQWWREADVATRARVPGRPVGAAEAVLSICELCLSSPASWSILPIQDLLGLGAEARMNTPGTIEGNWTWRLRREELKQALSGLYARVVRHRRF